MAPILAISGVVPLLLLGSASAILYVSGRIVMGSIPAWIDRSTLRALIGITMVTAVAITAIVMGRANIGLHLPVATATAAMTFGVAALLSTRGARVSTEPVDAPAGVRSWALLLPAVAMLLLGATSGRLDWAVMLLLVAYGATAMLCWPADVKPRVPVASLVDAPKPAEPKSASFALLMWIAGGALACVAGMLAVFGVPGLEMARGTPSDALAAVFLIAPAIVVPMVFELLPPCRPIGFGPSVSSLAKFALINLCFVVPAASMTTGISGVVNQYQQLSPTRAATTMPATTQATTQSNTQSTTAPVASVSAPVVMPAIIFPNLPATALRADMLVLAGAALLLVPMAANWTRPGRLEAVVLAGCYLLNLLLTMFH